ncbi:hypothetical protein Lal_00043329 [Lupinus albus]|nr:hypothetical protein Lal_00043329 [Lupinus albus]
MSKVETKSSIELVSAIQSACSNAESAEFIEYKLSQLFVLRQGKSHRTYLFPELRERVLDFHQQSNHIISFWESYHFRVEHGTLENMMKKEPSVNRVKERFNQDDTTTCLYSFGTTKPSKDVFPSQWN